MLDHSEGVFNPGPGPVALLVEGLVRIVELSLSGCLAQYTPFHALRFRLRLPPLAHVGLVAVDHLLLAMQTYVHQGNVVCIRRRYRHTMHQTTLLQHIPPQLKHPPRQPVLLQYMAKLSNRRLIGRLASVYTCENTHRQVVVQRILHGRIPIPIPLLQKINTQHRNQTDRRTPLYTPAVKRPDQVQHCFPRKNRVHLRQETLLPGLLGTIPVTRVFK